MDTGHCNTEMRAVVAEVQGGLGRSALVRLAEKAYRKESRQNGDLKNE